MKRVVLIDNSLYALSYRDNFKSLIFCEFELFASIFV